MFKKVLAWKYGIAIAFILVAAYATARKDEKTRDQYEQECNQLYARTVSPASHSEDCDIGADKAARNLPLRYHLFAWPEGITVWAILLTLFAIAEQTNQTRRAADAGAETANAAYGSLTYAEAQLDLMREKERARLELNVHPTDLDVEVAGDDLVHLIATVSVRNIGASKAFIGRTSGTLITRLRNEALENSDDYSPLDFPEQVIAPDQLPVPIRVYCFPTTTARTFAECLEEGTFSLHFFGFIEYQTLGLRWRKDFGYDWMCVERGSGLSGLYGLSDPYPNSPRPAKDRITYGIWHPNEERDKPEYPISGEQESEDKNPN